MKITNINAREDVSGKHNDRNFNVDYATHINQDKMSENLYWTYNGDTESTFEEIERDFYDLHFSEKLEEINKKHLESRHRERIKSKLDYYHSKYTRPEDKILQIGNINEHASKEELWDCAIEYKDRFNELYGDHCVILDMALHMDEATPHVHMRRVWIAEDENGLEYVSQTKALEQLGIPAPQPEREIDKFNNPKIMMTQNEVELFRQVCIDRGLDIDPPKERERKREHLSVLEFKKSKVIEELNKVEEQLDAYNRMMFQFIKDNPFMINLYADELRKAKKKSQEEFYRKIAEIFCKEYSKVFEEGSFENAALKVKQESFEKYLKEKGLQEDYLEWEDMQKEDVIR